MLTIAIDPGAKGALAMRCSDGRVVCQGLGETPKDIYDQLAFLAVRNAEVRVIVEKVGQHMAGNNATASCKFARHCGHIEMALIALGLPFDEVSPQKWMRGLGVPSKLDKGARKNLIKDKMQRLHPNIKVTLQNADALAILAWHESTQKDQSHG